MTYQLSKNELLNKVLWLIIFLVLTALVFFFVKKQEYKQGQTNGQTVVLEGEQKINEETPRYKIDIAYPLVQNDDSISKYVVETVSNFKKNALDEENFPEGSSCNQHELNGSYKKVESKKTWATVTYIYSMYEFTCGAHGNTALTTFTFDSTGKPVGLDAIIFPGNFSSVSKKFGEELIIPKLKSQLGDMYNEEMVRSGLFGEDGVKKDGFLAISPYENFAISDDGATFIFEQYQVAPYAAGMPEVFLSWQELLPYSNSSPSASL
jgi:hypothetical protein